METLTFEEIEQAVHKNPVRDHVEDSRDWQYDEIMGDVDLPRTFSLRKQMTAVKSQGQRGTCVGFAATGMSEFFNAKEYNDPKLDLSEEYLFRRIKEYDVADQNYDGYGANMRSGCKALHNYGTCSEKLAPYNRTNDEGAWKTFITTPKMDEEAKTYRIANYMLVTKAEQAIKQALVGSQAPLFTSVTLFESYRGAKGNGLIPVPKAGEKRIGGHAMVITGYDDYGIEFKNSWGKTWGDDGYVWWPWEAMGQLGGSIWAFVDVINNPNAIKEQLIEQNKKLLLPWQVEAWNKGLAKGILNEGSVPTATLTKGDFMVFMDRFNLLP